ncbi:hypothetical protein [Phytohabitans kaempferiae]|uniref:Uncharacterized protein n=1 Tax=Phytohabitans kaempferiae TaxID=1620943 RepID=A0ABV6M5G6_9ACTN
MRARLRRFREWVPLGWRAVVLLAIAGVAYAAGLVLAPSILVAAVAAQAIVARLTAERRQEQEVHVEKAILVVHSNPVPGREDEYNKWYDSEHVPEMLAVPGFVSAQRYVAHGTPEFRYLTIYEIEGPVTEALTALSAAKLSVSASLDQRVSVVPYVPHGRST